jgi:lipoyl(octanoyl) transferase
MNAEPPVVAGSAAEAVLQVYLLGSLDFDTALSLQRRLVYEIAGDRTQAALILCEHPPLITVGRQGSWRHILAGFNELKDRRLAVRWVNRGGGCLLHALGQLAIYPILPLDHMQLSVPQYLNLLQDTLRAVLHDFSVHTTRHLEHPGLLVADRPIAEIGVAVRDWVSYYGAALNINPDLEPFHLVQTGGGGGAAPMTSLERERHGPLRPALVRQCLLEHFAARFGFERTTLFSDHAALRRKASPNALVTPS